VLPGARWERMTLPPVVIVNVPHCQGQQLLEQKLSQEVEADNSCRLVPVTSWGRWRRLTLAPVVCTSLPRPLRFTKVPYPGSLPWFAATSCCGARRIWT